jgi:hemoglobin
VPGPRATFALAAALAALCVGCATPPWHRTTLYEDLGGERGIERLVAAFLGRLSTDPRVAGFFLHTNVERFERMLREHTCQIADGPCAYTGDTMSDVHRGLGIGQADFDAVVEDLQMAMDDLRLPFAVQSRLLARLAPLREEIVEGDPCAPFAWSAASRERCAARAALRRTP